MRGLIGCEVCSRCAHIAHIALGRFAKRQWGADFMAQDGFLLTRVDTCVEKDKATSGLVHAYGVLLPRTCEGVEIDVGRPCCVVLDLTTLSLLLLGLSARMPAASTCKATACKATPLPLLLLLLLLAWRVDSRCACQMHGLACTMLVHAPCYRYVAVLP